MEPASSDGANPSAGSLLRAAADVPQMTSDNKATKDAEFPLGPVMSGILDNLEKLPMMGAMIECTRTLAECFGSTFLFAMFFACQIPVNFLHNWLVTGLPYLLKEYDIGATGTTLIIGVSNTPSSFVPVVAIFCVLFPMFGFRLRPMVFAFGALGAACLMILGSGNAYSLSLDAAVLCNIGGDCGCIASYLMGLVIMADKVREKPEMAHPLNSFYQVTSLFASSLSQFSYGVLREYFGTHFVLSIGAILFVPMVIFLATNSLGEARVTHEETVEARSKILTFPGLALVILGLTSAICSVAVGFANVWFQNSVKTQMGFSALWVGVLLLATHIFLRPEASAPLIFGILSLVTYVDFTVAEFYFMTDTNADLGNTSPVSAQMTPFFYFSIAQTWQTLAGLLMASLYTAYMKTWKMRSIATVAACCASFGHFPKIVMMQPWFFNSFPHWPALFFIFPFKTMGFFLLVIQLTMLCSKLTADKYGLTATATSIWLSVVVIGQQASSYVGAAILEIFQCTPNGSSWDAQALANTPYVYMCGFVAPLLTLALVRWGVPDVTHEDVFPGQDDDPITKGSPFERWYERYAQASAESAALIKGDGSSGSDSGDGGAAVQAPATDDPFLVGGKSKKPRGGGAPPAAAAPSLPR